MFGIQPDSDGLQQTINQFTETWTPNRLICNAAINIFKIPLQDTGVPDVFGIQPDSDGLQQTINQFTETWTPNRLICNAAINIFTCIVQSARFCKFIIALIEQRAMC